MNKNPLLICGPDFLRDCVKACESVGVKPFLVMGTLLGFVRENDFIAHDHDIDLGLLDEDFGKKNSIKEILLKKGYTCRIDDDYLISFVHPEYPSLFVEFNRVYKKDGQMVIGTSCFFPIEAMNGFCTVSFHNSRILIPSNPEIFLSTAYGEWQKEVV